MRTPRPAALMCFAGGSAALLGLAWDFSIHSANPALAAHESPVDLLSPAHDLIACGILVAAVGGAWAVAGLFGRWLGAAALVPIVLGAGWIGFTAFDPPPEPYATPEQRAAADQLWNRTHEATLKYRSLRVARAAGYVPFNPFGDQLVHYGNPEYMHDGVILDPARVESLVYENTLHGPVLVAAMYSLEDPYAAPPDVAGALTPWHKHDDSCFTPDGEVVGSAPYCPAGSGTYLTPWMLHVWFIPNRYGRFAADPDQWSVLIAEVTG